MNTVLEYNGTLAEALQDIFILAGSRLYLRQNTFSGDFENTLSGISVLLLQEHAYIDGALTVNGDTVVFRDIDIVFTGWATRQSANASGTDMPLTKTLNIYAPSCSFINCNIYDTAGVGFWVAATAAEFYGNHVYHIGWLGTDRGHGHALYTQNQAGAKKTIKHNIFHDCFGWGIHAYSPSGANLQDFDILENISFRAGSLAGSARPNILVGGDSGLASNILLDGNHTYGGALGISFYGAGAENVTLKNNYCPDNVGGIYTAIEETNNYWGPTVGNHVAVYQNVYKTDRLHVAVYNETGANTVNVDVSAYFSNGDQVTVRNTQDYQNDIQTVVVAGGNVAVDMQAANHTVETPVQWTAPATTFPDFGAFVIERI